MPTYSCTAASTVRGRGIGHRPGRRGHLRSASAAYDGDGDLVSSTAYTYDEANRLTSWNTGATTTDYT